MSKPSALHFPIFQSAHYSGSNQDAVKDVKRGRYKSVYDHWQEIGRDEYLAGKRKPPAEMNGFEFDEARYVSACTDVKDALAARLTPSAFEHWMRYGLMETLAGTRNDAFGLLRKEPTCVFDTVEIGSEWITLIAIPGLPGGEEHSLKVRDVNGGWTDARRMLLRRWPGTAVSASAEVGWTFTAFSTPTAPGQVFLGIGENRESWTEVMVLRVAGTENLRVVLDEINLAQLIEDLARNELFRKAPEALLALLPAFNLSQPSAREQLHVDNLQVLNGAHLLVAGWFLDRVESWEKMIIIVGGDAVTIDREQCFLYARTDLKSISGVTDQDVVDTGIVAISRFSGRAVQNQKAVAIGIGKSRAVVVEAVVTVVSDAPDAILRHCIQFVSGTMHYPGRLAAFLRAGAGQVFADMIKRKHEAIDSAFEERKFGSIPVNPCVSIIIPLYGRMDFIQFQLAHFSQDPDIRGVEIIYVLDDPKNYMSCIEYASYASRLFDVPIRLMLNRDNHGYGGANNIGASQARGEILVFLNSDVIPTVPGWVSRLTKPLDAQCVGVVGARLLYHDGTIQHDGMIYQISEMQSAFGGLVELAYPGKGVVPQLRSGEETEETPLVTGACMAIRRADFEQVGRFSLDYFVGDYDDSDLCLRIRQLDKQILLARHCILHHLERQSIPRTVESTVISIINAYIHQSKWKAILETWMPAGGSAK